MFTWTGFAFKQARQMNTVRQFQAHPVINCSEAKSLQPTAWIPQQGGTQALCYNKPYSMETCVHLVNKLIKVPPET